MVKLHREWRGLLDAIIRDPKDDGLRMIAADWLSDQGQEAHADMIRVQVELAQRRYKCEVTGKGSPSRGAATNPSCCRTCELWCRDVELRKQVVYPTTNKLSQKGINLKHARGFVCSASMDIGDWREIGALMVRLHPLEGGVKFPGKRPRPHGHPVGSMNLFGWFSYGKDNDTVMSHAADDIPHVIWCKLRGHLPVEKVGTGGGWKHYEDIKMAMNCLRAAALEYAWTQPDPITTD